MENSLSQKGKWFSDKSYFDFKPGEERRYSNLGAGVCQYIIEKTTGEKFESFVQKHIFNPLQIKNVAWGACNIKNTTKLFYNDSTYVTGYH